MMQSVPLLWGIQLDFSPISERLAVSSSQQEWRPLWKGWRYVQLKNKWRIYCTSTCQNQLGITGYVGLMTKNIFIVFFIQTHLNSSRPGLEKFSTPFVYVVLRDRVPLGRRVAAWLANLGMHGGCIAGPLWTDCGPPVHTPNIPT